MLSTHGGGWCEGGSWSPAGGAVLVFACVIVTVLVSPCVGAMCTWGPVPLAHMCSQHCAGMSCLALPLTVKSKRACGTSHWFWGQFVDILIHVTSDPERACPWLKCVGMCGWSNEQNFQCPWWQVCIFACVFQLWPEYLCQSSHGCPGRVWMWVVCQCWGQSV